MGIIVFLGDSITDAGRKDSPNQLGYGYVNIFAESLKESGADWNIVNRGVDGYITERVARTLHNDCISIHPDYVSILVGINDIGMIVHSQVSWQDKLYLLEDSIRSYHEMLFDLSRETEAKVITLEPFVFPKEETYQDWVPWQKKMSKPRTESISLCWDTRSWQALSRTLFNSGSNNNIFKFSVYCLPKLFRGHLQGGADTAPADIDFFIV